MSYCRMTPRGGRPPSTPAPPTLYQRGDENRPMFTASDPYGLMSTLEMENLTLMHQLRRSQLWVSRALSACLILCLLQAVQVYIAIGRSTATLSPPNGSLTLPTSNMPQQRMGYK
jgi:hypothetical protein